MNLEHAVLPRVLPCALLQEKSEPGSLWPLYGVQKGLKEQRLWPLDGVQKGLKERRLWPLYGVHKGLREHGEMEALTISSVNLITVLITDRAMETKSHCGVPAPCCVY